MRRWVGRGLEGRGERGSGCSGVSSLLDAHPGCCQNGETWLHGAVCSTTTNPRLPCPSGVLQHYAAKALENVFGLGGPWAQHLAGPEAMGNLVQVG